MTEAAELKKDTQLRQAQTPSHVRSALRTGTSPQILGAQPNTPQPRLQDRQIRSTARLVILFRGVEVGLQFSTSKVSSNLTSR